MNFDPKKFLNFLLISCALSITTVFLFHLFGNWEEQYGDSFPAPKEKIGGHYIIPETVLVEFRNRCVLDDYAHSVNAPALRSVLSPFLYQPIEQQINIELLALVCD